MKYTHEFAIKHLPLFVIASMLLVVGLGFLVTAIYYGVTEPDEKLTALLSSISAVFVVFSSFMFSEAVEYIKTLTVEKRTKLNPAIQERKDRALDMELRPDEETTADILKRQVL